MAITPTAVQAFYITDTKNAGTYTLINGVIGKRIRIIQYDIVNENPYDILLQDTAGGLINTIRMNSRFGQSGVTELPVDLGLQAVLTGTTTYTAYFMGIQS